MHHAQRDRYRRLPGEESPAREDGCARAFRALRARIHAAARLAHAQELLRHQRPAKPAEDARLITLTKELERATTGLDRLYQAVEEGALSIDETLCARTQKLKARRSEILTEMAKLKDRQALAVRWVNADTVKAFCSALKARFNDQTHAPALDQISPLFMNLNFLDRL